MPEETYTLTIRPTPQKTGEPPVEVRLRQVLKLMLRGFGLRCLDITKSPPQADPTNPTPKKETTDAPE